VLVATHTIGQLSHWLGTIALLVYVFEKSGATAMGIASAITLSPAVLGASVASRLLARHSPLVLRRIALGVAALALLATAGVMSADAPSAAPVATTVVALGMLVLLRPTAAAALPLSLIHISEPTRPY